MTRLAVAFAMLSGLVGSGAAQGLGAGGAPPCVLDKCLQAAPASEQASTSPRAPLAPGAFDFWVLALSWSPAFCDTGGAAKSPDQCAEGRGLGFVVHGLWPQYSRGYPSNCPAGSQFPSRSALESVTDLYPDVGLARHEWRVHGTCSGLSPTAYFATVRQAREAVAIPPFLQRVEEPQTRAPLEIARAFAAANRGLRPDMMAVTCRQGELQEVRLCLTKDLRGFTSCPEVARDACRSRSLSILPVR